MQELLSYLYRRNEEALRREYKAFIFASIFIIIFTLITWLLIMALKYRCDQCWQLPVLLLIGFSMNFFMITMPEYVKDACRIILFKRSFGFYPAITDEERSVTLLRIDNHMKEVAAELRYAYSEKDIATHNLEEAVASASSGKTSLDLDCLFKLNKLAKSKKESSMKLKEKFYRDIKIAKKLGFVVRSSFKDYQTEW